MAIIKDLRGFKPEIGDNVFLAETAVIIGDVSIGAESSIWYGAVLRGDVNTIKIGSHTNIQDNAVVHTLYQRSVTEIGDYVSVGHNATVHGAKICNHCLIGMGATILDNAVVGEGCIIAANALVLSNSVLEPYGVYAGVPAKRVKEVSEEQKKNVIERTAKGYEMYAEWYK
ncbi:MAG: gamma carbonic anhydrase family protein [Rikenellaceae bacterium]